MTIKLFDTAQRAVVPFEVDRVVRMYVCGITPYDVTHLGHASTYIWADLVDRVLSWHGHTVTVARNVTDVDEVLFAEARRRGESYSMMATLHRATFEGTMATLRVRVPDHSPTAAQAVGHVVQLATALLARDRAYVRGGTVYARTAAAASGLDHDTALRLSAEYHDHPDAADKDDPLDVAVWQETSDEEVSWPSPWGEGRPGWHAECAAMVLALYGPSVDIHCGGADLAYPHHACEAALAEGATGVAPFARSWLRAGVVRVGGACPQRMAIAGQCQPLSAVQIPVQAGPVEPGGESSRGEHTCHKHQEQQRVAPHGCRARQDALIRTHEPEGGP